MTRASYNTDNTLTELPGMMRPEDWHYWDDEEYKEKLAEYTAHVATLRTIPCSPECRGLFEVGKTYEEGKDYEVRQADWMPETEEEYNQAVYESKHELAGPVPKVLTAFPLPVKSEDDRQHIEAIIRTALVPEVATDAQRDQCAAAVVDLLLQHNFIITKR